MVDRGERLYLLCYQEHISSICGPSCQILVQEPGKEADPEKIRGKKVVKTNYKPKVKMS